MKRAILLAAAAWILLTSANVGFAQTKQVHRKSGPPLIGTVTRQDDTYVVTTPVGAIEVQADDVVSITDYVTFEEEYSRRVLALEPEDAEGRYRLAQWCMSQRKPEQARDQLQAALRINPDHRNARLLLQLVEEELAERQRPTREPGRRPETLPGTTTPLSAFVSDEDVMRIRLAELRSHDRVSITFRDRADLRFAERMQGIGRFADPAYRLQFLRKSPVDKAVEMLVTLPDATDLHRDILVRTNPQFMSWFKTRIWPMVAAHCASAQCHGGAEGAGRLKLYNVRSQSDMVFFTNFLILNAYQSNRGRMIDRARPPQSLLLQFGLPKEEARVSHPRDIRPMFRGVDGPRYRMVLTWIKEHLLHPHPKYDIDYSIPGIPSAPPPSPEPDAADAPADQDAAGPPSREGG